MMTWACGSGRGRPPPPSPSPTSPRSPTFSTCWRGCGAGLSASRRTELPPRTGLSVTPILRIGEPLFPDGARREDSGLAAPLRPPGLPVRSGSIKGDEMEPRRPLRYWRKTAVVTATALALTMVFAGCAGPSTPTGTSGAPEPEVPEVIPMTVARGAVTIENSILAHEQGFFEEAGLDVDLQVTGGGGGAATNSALIAGEMDIAATDAVTAVRAINENMPIVVVAGTKSADPNQEGDASDGLIVPPGSPIADWSDLRGKKIGVPELGGLPHLTVVAALEENDIPLSEVEFVPIPVDALVPAAENGQVDAIFTFSIFLLQAVDGGFTRVGTGVREFLPYAPQVVWVASREYVENNPEAVERFLTGLGEGTEFSNENPDEVRRVYRENTELPPPFIDNVMALDVLSVEFDQKGWDRMLEIMKTLGEVRDDLTFEELVWEGAR
ncbi:ABC transporter substrate-binding protein [Microbacterium lushaniae]|uniref:ABC transporter substrate-binding protein n=2 Tax=Microbacterium lushaniae TaxID=2614639 RepID=A0A5J6L4I3_9MICO|nr:ABC transporter substrate-binding protein [Microbacterium lushaniae]